MAQVNRTSLQMQNSREAIIMAAAFPPALGKDNERVYDESLAEHEPITLCL